MQPTARKEHLLIQEVGNELVIYDQERHHAHRLNPTAALVWQHSDGQRTVADLAQLLDAATEADKGEAAVWAALDSLEQVNLMEEATESAKLTRRQMVRKMSLAGGLAVALPLVTSITAPTPAMAASTPSFKAPNEGGEGGSNLGGYLLGGAAVGGAVALGSSGAGDVGKVYMVELTQDVALHEAPEVGSRNVGTLTAGNSTRVRLLKTQGEWRQIRTADGRTGWVQGNNLLRTAKAAPNSQASGKPQATRSQKRI